MPHHLAAEPEMGEHPSHHRFLLQNWLARMAQVQVFEHKPRLEGVVIPQESIWKLSHSSVSGTHGLRRQIKAAFWLCKVEYLI